MKILTIAAIASLSITIAHAEDTPRQAAEKAVAQEMAKAQAQKARNDAIVAKQRAAEKAAKEKARAASSDNTKAKEPKPAKSAADKAKAGKSK